MSKNKTFSYGSKVIVGDLPLNMALRKFKQRVEDSNKLEEFKQRLHYEKPTTSRKRKAGAARARWLKTLKDQELPNRMY